MINPINSNIVKSELTAATATDPITTTSTDFEKKLAEAEAAKKKQEDAKLKETCKQLESVFLNMMLQQMQSTVQKSDLFGDDSASKTYNDMLYEKYADEMSKGNGIGIADVLYKQLSKNNQNATTVAEAEKALNTAISTENTASTVNTTSEVENAK